MGSGRVGLRGIQVSQQLFIIQFRRENTIRRQFLTPLSLPYSDQCQRGETSEEHMIWFPIENKRRISLFSIIQTEKFPELRIPAQTGDHVLLDTVNFVDIAK